MLTSVGLFQTQKRRWLDTDAEVKLVGLMFPPQDRVQIIKSCHQAEKKDANGSKHNLWGQDARPSPVVRRRRVHLQNNTADMYSMGGGGHVGRGGTRGPSPRLSPSPVPTSAQALMSGNRLSSASARARLLAGGGGC